MLDYKKKKKKKEKKKKKKKDERIPSFYQILNPKTNQNVYVNH